MNRFKKEIRKRGYEIENDFPYMPYQVGLHIIEAIKVNAEKACVTVYTTSISYTISFKRNLKAEVL